MTHRTIEADVLEFKDRLIVVKSDSIDQSTIKAISNSFKKKGYEGIVIVGLSLEDSIETLTKEQAIYILKKIIDKPEAE